VPAGTPGALDIGAYRQRCQRAGRAAGGTAKLQLCAREPATAARAAALGVAPGHDSRPDAQCGREHAPPPSAQRQTGATDDGTPAWVRFAGTSQLKIPAGDPLPQLTGKRRKFIASHGYGGAQHAGTIARVRAKRTEAMAAAFAESTRGMQLTAMRAFVEFCAVYGVAYTDFGTTDGDRVPTPAQLGAEDEFLADFACFVVLFPRHGRADGPECNLGSTAVSYVSHVRSWYETHLVPPRRPGSGYIWNKNDHLGATLRRCLDGLRKVHPRTGAKSRPIERHVMVKLARRLRHGDKWARTKWAIYATCWQAGRRIGECIRSNKRTGPWDPARDMHRGRASFRKVDGRIATITIAIGPNKTDKTGEKDFHCHLPYSADAEINAAAAILEMLALDPTETGHERDTPLFRDWRPGKSGGMVAYSVLRRELIDDLAAIGETELAAGTHSFRRGCATALGGIGAPDTVTRMIGLWATDANLGYTWASSPIVERKMLEMAEWDGRVDHARGPIVRRR